MGSGLVMLLWGHCYGVLLLLLLLLWGQVLYSHMAWPP